jgi:hypothetical protein
MRRAEIPQVHGLVSDPEVQDVEVNEADSKGQESPCRGFRAWWSGAARAYEVPLSLNEVDRCVVVLDGTRQCGRGAPS